MSEQAKHTPGPWTVRGRSVVTDARAKTGPSRIVLFKIIRVHPREEDAADLALAAAAPELLESAKAFESGLSEYCDGSERDALRAAIAKATGVTQ